MNIYELKITHEAFLKLADGIIEQEDCTNNKNIKERDILMIGDFDKNIYYNRFLFACVENVVEYDDHIVFDIKPISKIIYDKWGFFE